MNRSEVAILLGLAATRDYRHIGDTDVLAWHQDLEDIEFEDAKLAVSLYYRENTDRIMPAHVRRIVRQIRTDQRRVTGQHEVRALPGRFETDDMDRQIRNERGGAAAREALAMVIKHLAQRSGQTAPLDQLREITPGPAWPTGDEVEGEVLP
ncbi:hypothetical protein BDK92_7303 [Micromonospora pisi]|uniref:Uncharacterized protein n=1 Tax=Micromonospora pisi TaxID=589240 RepID=A0A495JVG0_9ACTN|nr:hypothetical protein [Micromonospora pisi]RKR92821.1 hypothetical protein BDK92_7303 [Micromonospora pisi]